MPKPLTIAGAALLVGAAGLTAFLATRSGAYRVTRALELAAPPHVVLAELSNLQRWPAWSQDARCGQEVERRFGGPQRGVGQSGFWLDRSGRTSRRVTLVALSPTGVDAEVEDEGAERSLRDLQLRVEPAAAGARLTWTVEGENDLARRLLALAWSPDEALGRELEGGLARLKAVVEAEARVASFRVERSERVGAPVSVVRALLATPRRFTDWSPWEPVGPGVERAYGGPASGVGATYYWSAPNQHGPGRLTVTEAHEARILMELAVERARQLSCDLEVLLVPEGEGTRITAIASGEQRGPDDAPVGADAIDRPSASELELGLARLKVLAEAEARLAQVP